MEEHILIHTKHYTNSVVEVYINSDKTKIYQIKCLTRNRCRKYTFDIKDYIKNGKASGAIGGNGAKYKVRK